VTVKQIAREAF